jgi:hypothetical protein
MQMTSRAFFGGEGIITAAQGDQAQPSCGQLPDLS